MIMKVDILLQIENNKVLLGYYSAYKYKKEIVILDKHNFNDNLFVINGCEYERKISNYIKKAVESGKTFYVTVAPSDIGYVPVVFESLKDAIVGCLVYIVALKNCSEDDNIDLYVDFETIVGYANLLKEFKNSFVCTNVKYLFDMARECNCCHSLFEPHAEKEEQQESVVDNAQNEPKETMQQIFEKMVGYNHDEFEKQITRQFGELTGIW